MIVYVYVYVWWMHSSMHVSVYTETWNHFYKSHNHCSIDKWRTAPIWPTVSLMQHYMRATYCRSVCVSFLGKKSNKETLVSLDGLHTDSSEYCGSH